MEKQTKPDFKRKAPTKIAAICAYTSVWIAIILLSDISTLYLSLSYSPLPLSLLSFSFSWLSLFSLTIFVFIDVVTCGCVRPYSINVLKINRKRKGMKKK